ncbi:MAG: NUDIX hydrolase [Pseudomonadales bacterium]|nr:NUDIX hydrolase [Pseudomonadales bacterium]
MNYCNQCGEAVSQQIPEGDNRLRYVCATCTTIHYENPKVITGCLPIHEDQVLLCKRAIEPRSGLWTLPAGFLENGETSADGALRETMEEANARVNIEGLYTLFSLPHISQVYMFFRATLQDLDFYAGEESLEVQLFNEDEIPWDNLAFPVITETLKHYFKDRTSNTFETRYMDIVIERSRK